MYKKIAVLFAIVLIIGITFLSAAQPIFKGYAEEFTYYYNSYSSKSQSEKVRGLTLKRGKCGESFVADKGFDVEKLVSDFRAEAVRVEKAGEVTSLYYYTDKIPYFKTIGGKKINLHVAIDNDTVTVGTPIIFGSF